MSSLIRASLARPKARFGLGRRAETSAFAALFCVLAGCAEPREPKPSQPEREDAATEPAADAEAVLDGAVDAAVLPAPGPLVNNALWKVLAPDEDPFMESPMAPCPPLSAEEEFLGGELVFALRTELCPSLTAMQPSRREVLPGDTLEVRAYHFPLTAPESATAELVVKLGEQEIFQQTLPIPSVASELMGTYVAQQAFPEGTPVLFHVENHGENEYVLISIDVTR